MGDIMDGIIVVDKPKDYTSRDVVNVISKSLNIKKVGHTGTLDPLATGVLVIVVGKATKLVDYLTSTEKEYIARMVFGIDTDTLDITGNILSSNDVKIEESNIDVVLDKYRGKYMQKVPKYSAVKVKGKKLYEYARNNMEVELPSREVNIVTLDKLNFFESDGKDYLDFKTLVSKGTYIRSLIRDIASSLNTCGVMTDLKRTKQGDFTIDMAYTLDEVKNNNYKLISIANVFKDDIKCEIPKKYEHRINNGNKIPNDDSVDEVLFLRAGEAVALYVKDGELLKPKLMF